MYFMLVMKTIILTFQKLHEEQDQRIKMERDMRSDGDERWESLNKKNAHELESAKEQLRVGTL